MNDLGEYACGTGEGTRRRSSPLKMREVDICAERLGVFVIPIRFTAVSEEQLEIESYGHGCIERISGQNSLTGQKQKCQVKE